MTGIPTPVFHATLISDEAIVLVAIGAKPNAYEATPTATLAQVTIAVVVPIAILIFTEKAFS